MAGSRASIWAPCRIAGVGRTALIYFAGIAGALLIAVHHVRIIRGRDPAACFRAFLGNHWLGMAVFAGIALDYAIRAGRWPHAL